MKRDKVITGRVALAVKTGGTVGGDPERNGAVLGVIGVTRDVPLWGRDVVMWPQLCVCP